MKTIKASNGMYLTQKVLENEDSRVFAIALNLAVNDSPDNWREATQEEYYQWQVSQQEQLERSLSNGVGEE